MSYLETNALYPLSYAPKPFYGHTHSYVTMNIGHFQLLVSRRERATVELHCSLERR